MNSTIYNGYSGIKTHQFGLDSVSNNIANINTTGYRANLPEFKSLFANALNSTNPNSPVSSDMNYGSTIGSNAISNNDGNYKESDEELSVAYAGKGWFVVGDNENKAIDATSVEQGVYFTRDGSFSRDAQGYIVNAAGYYMLGVDLGKIKDGVFISDSENDEANLATGKIQPIQIPQNLHYGPTETNEVNLALNLNPNQDTLSAYRLFLDTNGKIDEAKLLNQDINSLLTDGENINANAFNNIIIKITKEGKAKEVTFNYGDFKTLGELKQLIKQETNLDLDFAREPNGDIDKNLILELKSPGLDEMEVSIEGKLLAKLGLKGEKKLSNFNIASFNAGQNYNVNDLVRLDGIVFKRVESAGNSSPLEDSNFWQMLDSSAAREWSEEESYQINDLVKWNNQIYQKINEANTSPQSPDWRLVGESKTLEIASFDSNENYSKNSFVYFNNHIYQKISDEVSKNPDNDVLNWRIVEGEKFLSDKLHIANYKTTTDIFDDKGDKMVIISEFVLNNNAQNNQVWNVRTGIYDKNGENLLSDVVEHQITFDENNKAIASPITLTYGNHTLQYNIAQANNKSSTNFSYTDSSLVDSFKDGTQKGDLTNIGIDNDGVINLSFSNGVTEKMGRVGIVAFVNDKGLQKTGGNLFEITSINVNNEGIPPSGEPLLGWDENGKLRFGQVLHKYLETSNVNPADAMTDLIVFQRGYSMNAKAFTTGDDLIKEAINLKR